MTIYWLGGSPCAGKTTISEIIAQEFGWQVYHLDRHVERYLQRATPQHQPHLTAYKQMGLQAFLLQASHTQLTQVLSISAEQFPFILEDLSNLSQNKPILVEGANMRPVDVRQQINQPSQALWMVPTEAFQLDTYPKRGSWVQDVLRRYDTPDEGIRAFERWMQRDALMAQHSAEQARQQGIRVIVVDGKRSLFDNAEIVMRHFGLLS
ncbi:MAG: hypothetical protein ACFE0Q_03100 [Anaerolineae bacterium]